MDRDAVAQLFEQIGTAIEQLPGVSRRNPHAFAEAKSELAGKARRIARELQVAGPASDLAAAAAAILPGQRVIAGRRVSVETRRRIRRPTSLAGHSSR